MRWHVVSFPRSGNHAVRAIIEKYTRRPTRGGWGASADTPIYLRKPNRDAGEIDVQNEEPIAFKAHRIYEMHQNEREQSETMGMMLITRDPVDAISSQVCRHFRFNPLPTGRMLRRTVYPAIENYVSLLSEYAARQGKPRIRIRFEDLLGRDQQRSLETSRTIVSAFGVDPGIVQKGDLEDLFQVSKESQVSLSTLSHGVLLARVRDMVASMLTYADVERILGGGHVSGLSA